MLYGSPDSPENAPENAANNPSLLEQAAKRTRRLIGEHPIIASTLFTGLAGMAYGANTYLNGNQTAINDINTSAVGPFLVGLGGTVGTVLGGTLSTAATYGSTAVNYLRNSIKRKRKSNALDEVPAQQNNAVAPAQNNAVAPAQNNAVEVIPAQQNVDVPAEKNIVIMADFIPVSEQIDLNVPLEAEVSEQQQIPASLVSSPMDIDLNASLKSPEFVVEKQSPVPALIFTAEKPVVEKQPSPKHDALVVEKQPSPKHDALVVEKQPSPKHDALVVEKQPSPKQDALVVEKQLPSAKKRDNELRSKLLDSELLLNNISSLKEEIKAREAALAAKKRKKL